MTAIYCQDVNESSFFLVFIFFSKMKVILKLNNLIPYSYSSNAAYYSPNYKNYFPQINALINRGRGFHYGI